MQSPRIVTATFCQRVYVLRSAISQCCLVVLLLPLYTWAQVANQPNTGCEPPKEAFLDTDVAIKLRAATELSSATLRVGDYVEFIVVEDVLAPDKNGDPQVVIAKDTIAFGKVIERHHKFTILKKGAFRVRLESLRAVDRQEITNVRIIRPNNYPACPKESLRTDPKASKQKDNPSPPQPNCIGARVYSGTFRANLPSAIITAGSTAALVLANNPTAKAAAAITLVQQISTQPGLGTLLNGVDAVISPNEYFDAYLQKAVVIKVPPPKKEK
jgi:hypothetical protein